MQHLKKTDTKLYVPIVTLSTKDNNSFLEQLKSGFKRTIKWNKYRSEMTNQTKTNHLSYLIDPTFTKVNRLFVLSIENEEDRTSFSKYYAGLGTHWIALSCNRNEIVYFDSFGVEHVPEEI